MKNTIANAMVALPVTPKTITYSSVIDLYNNKSLGTKKKEGKYMWNLTTDTSEEWKKDGISATVEHVEKILDIFKDRSVRADHNKILVAMATSLKQEHAKNKKIPGNFTISVTNTADTEPGNSTGPTA